MLQGMAQKALVQLTDDLDGKPIADGGTQLRFRGVAA